MQPKDRYNVEYNLIYEYWDLWFCEEGKAPDWCGCGTKQEMLDLADRVRRAEIVVTDTQKEE